MDPERFFTHKKVSSIVFGIFSPKLVKKMASAKIVTPELYDKEGYPVDGGLMDVRLGVIDPGLRCKTCGSKLKECIGHFGYIELARSVVHIKFTNIILNVLQGACRECGKALITKQKAQKFLEEMDRAEGIGGSEARRKVIKSAVLHMKANKVCPHCKEKQQKINVEKPTTYMEGDKRLSPIDIRTRLEKLPDDDCMLFGLNPKFVRPEWMILTVLPIPPVTMRPSITLESGERSEDDLTHKLGDIVRINQRLFENINAGAPEIIIEDLWDLLQYHVTTFFDNNIAQLPPARHRSGQPLKTITDRIKSKEGRIRYNLAGKRTNFSARTVISPDPMLSINEVGVPSVFALKLTIPERVTTWNIEYLKKFVKRGPDTYPGANYVIRPDGKKKKITSETKEQILEEVQPGYVVERHLMDGDIAIFNRQPSLHRMSMMCHKVRVLPNKTLKMNPAVNNPYNADFDGDEMNLHIPQTEEARAEAEILMMVQTQLISPRYGLSVIGCVQDAITGNYILTRDLSFSRPDAVEILFSIGISDFSKLPRKQTISGKELLSMIIPDDFSFKGKAKDGSPVIIEEGKLLEGTLDSANLGTGKGLLLRNVQQKYGASGGVKFLENLYKLSSAILLRQGFSVSLSDMDVSDEAKTQINSALDAAEKEVNDLIKGYETGELQAFPGRTVLETLELKILEILNRARNTAGELVAKHVDKNSQLFTIIQSGAKGNPINLAQMVACVGQQAMRGKRIERGYRGRTLTCFRKGDLRSAERGFIRSGFKKGLNPKEFFFGGMTGRDSLMDTALRTPKSGYLYRRLANALQDLKVEYDFTVRDASRKIVQFKYGEDGIDVSKSEKGRINVKRIIDNIV